MTNSVLKIITLSGSSFNSTKLVFTFLLRKQITKSSNVKSKGTRWVDSN